MTYGLVCFKDFFRRGLLEVCKEAIKDNVNILEVRNLVQITFDENGIISLDDEFELYGSVLEEARKINPDFIMKVIITSPKQLSRDEFVKQLNSYIYLKKRYSMVAGFDLVNEEDTTPPLKEFVEDIITARESLPGFQIYLHAGESTNRYNENLFDAILLGTKRIGHGLAIDFHPYLADLVIEHNIGYEICPISNYVLGYTLDFRWHPARNLMTKGVAVSISSDDPSFWDYKELSLDFAYAFLGWQLDLRDLKQLAINSIKHSSLTEEEVKDQLKIFYHQWDHFINSYEVESSESD